MKIHIFLSPFSTLISRYLYIGFLFFLCTCSESDNIPPIPPNNGKITPVERIIEPEIDIGDLENLPIDNGGEHIAYPLGVTDAEFGHYVYTPGGYEENGPKYPLILFLHGWGERGDSSDDPEILKRVLSHGPPKLIKGNHWEPRFPSIVVSPQLVTQYWPPDKIHKFIDYIIENYQVNTNRIYLTGLSLGGGGCWYYVGEIENNYAAAIVPISASGSAHLVDNLRKIPIWAFHGGKDNLVLPFEKFGSLPMVQAINATFPDLKAKVTIFPDFGHDAWTRTYDNSLIGTGYYTYDDFNMTVYDWMLQYKKE